MKKVITIISLLSISITACDSNKNSDEHSTNTVAVEQIKNSQPHKQQEVAIKVSKLLSQLSLTEKISLVHASGTFYVNGIKRLGIPELWLSDGPHGVRHEIEKQGWNSANRHDDYATYLPNLTSVAASWDINMATLHGDVLGSEARNRGKDIILGPGVNLARLPLNGRNFEYMGEDPILAAKLVVPEIIAIQHHDVSANVKHFVLNNQELNRNYVNGKPDERTLREVYLPAFEAAVKQGHVHSIMGAYNQYYGTNINQSKYLVKDILKGEWGFDGVLLTDWNVDINTYDAAMNGLDLEMGTNVKNYDDYFFADPLLAQIQTGKIPVSVLDDKVTRILGLMFNIGAFDQNRKTGERNTKAHQLAAKTIATNGVVLLKNEPINIGNQAKELLPLNIDKIKNILVLGPNANKKHGNGGGSSEVKSNYEVTPLQGLKNKFADKANITVMRARSSVLTAIAPDYVVSRHWTGTPAWNIRYFSDQSHHQFINESWLADPSYTPTKLQQSALQHLEMTAKIKPLKSGVHHLKVASGGKFELFIDGKKVLTALNNGNKLLSTDMNLTAGKEYEFKISYDGLNAFTLGWDAPSDFFTDESTYLTAAKKADVVIYFAGLSHSDDRESIDRTVMTLPNNQDEVIAKLLKVNPTTVVFMIAGSAVEMPWVKQANALIWGWYGGMEAGNAFADILVGDANPSGKMPITLPVHLADNAAIALNDYNSKETLYKEGVFIGYRWFEQQHIKPLFEFGYGLSYTNFEYNDIKLSTETLQGNEKLIVTATIKNIGKVAGAEVVELYLQDEVASVERPNKELKGFVKVFLQANESKKVNITLNKRDLSFWDVKNNHWLAESGDFKVMLGSSLNDIRLSNTFNYQQGL